MSVPRHAWAAGGPVTGTAHGLSLRGVTKTYGSGEGEVHALRGVDLEVEPGELVVVLGPSGSGKTTMVNIIGGIESATTGTVVVGGRRSAGTVRTSSRSSAAGTWASCSSSST